MSAPLAGEQVIQAIRAQTDTILLAFSCGKDSIAAWLACRPHFRRIVPYYMYFVPGLEFVEDSLRYYEDFFGTRIIRVPSPSLHRMLNNFIFQPPERCSVIEQLRLEDFEFLDMQDSIRDHYNLGPECFVASGVRAVDSPIRMLALRRYGAISEAKKQFFPVWDWRKARLLDALTEAKIQLPVDYRLFGRSFDGVDYRFLEPIRRHFPRDYERILDWYPLADAEIARRQFAETHV